MLSLTIKSKIGLDNYYRRNTKNKPPAFIFDALPEYLTDNLDFSSTTKLIFDKSKKIYTGNRTTVFRGELSAEDGSMEPLDVVIKTDIFNPHSKSLINEAKFYTTKLNDLQGLVIPLYYGIYRAEVCGEDVTCLVLQYCGEPIEEMLLDLDEKFKVQLMKRLDYIHRFGVAHGDFHELNVLDHNGVPFIVDFEDAVDHKCRRALKMNWGELWPLRSLFKCNELYDVAREIGVWQENTLYFYTTLVLVRTIKSAKQLAEMAPARFRATEADRREVLEEAHRVIKSLSQNRAFKPDDQALDPSAFPPSPLSSSP